MARNRIRSKATHTADITERSQTTTNQAGEPLYGTSTIASDVPVRYQAAGQGWTREVAGDRVRQSPSLQVSAAYADILDAGQTVVLSDGREFTIVKVNPRYGRTGVDHLEVEVERSD